MCNSGLRNAIPEASILPFTCLSAPYPVHCQLTVADLLTNCHSLHSYMSMVSYGFFCLTGTIGFYACYIFVRQIYSAVKVSNKTHIKTVLRLQLR